jgi:hypothetical protein
LSAGNFSSAQTFSAMSNSPSARYVPKRMFRLCSQNKYLSSAAVHPISHHFYPADRKRRAGVWP